MDDLLNGLIELRTEGENVEGGIHMYHGETVSLAHERWSTIAKSFFDKKTKEFDVSKIAAIYDNIKYPTTRIKRRHFMY